MSWSDQLADRLVSFYDEFFYDYDYGDWGDYDSFSNALSDNIDELTPKEVLSAIDSVIDGLNEDEVGEWSMADVVALRDDVESFASKVGRFEETFGDIDEAAAEGELVLDDELELF